MGEQIFLAGYGLILEILLNMKKTNNTFFFRRNKIAIVIIFYVI